MSTGSKGTDRKRTGRQPPQVMTARQLDAYLLSRETLRRIQRTSALLGATSLRSGIQHTSH